MSTRIRVCRPERIEGFLGKRLSESEQAELEDHLTECPACRVLLGDQTADDELWSKASRYLCDDECELDSLSGKSKSPVEHDHSLSIQQVLDALQPTDDPEMLGRFGGYEVSGVVGAGGMGVVLKAFDQPLDRTVAIKVLAPHLATSGAARKRFAREAKAAAAVLHPNVMAIHSVSNNKSLPFLVMPFVRGSSLQKRLDNEGPLPTGEILRIGSQIAAGLAAAHAQGLVHRDIKPANILLENGVERVAITDFGLARAVDDGTMTCTGVIAGTPQYMSPEQARAESVDQRSDLFSLGSVLYAMSTGRAPFRAETSYGVLRRITDEEPRPIREINPDVPDWLCQIIVRLMAKQPDGRFESAREVAELLEECLAHVQQPTSVPLPRGCLSQRNKSEGCPEPRAKRFRRLPAFKALAATAFAFALAFAAVLIVLELNKGTLTIESVADNVRVRITQGDKVVEQLTVSKTGGSVRVAAGEYLVEIEGDLDGITVENRTVRLRRGGREVVKIVRDDDTPAASHIGSSRTVPVPAETIDAPKKTADIETPGDGLIVAVDPSLSIDRLYGYRDFLWGSLRSLQHKRNELLTSITELEQALVELQQPVETPEDAKPDTKAHLVLQKQRQAGQIAQASDRTKALRAELDDIEEQIALIKKKLGEIPAASTTDQIAIEAEVIAVSDGHVGISVGAHDGVQPGMRLTVVRDKDYVGDIEVFKTASDESTARILDETVQSPIRRGDRATMLVDSGASTIIGKDAGNSIYNDRLKRFKFRLEKIDVTSPWEVAEEFWMMYRSKGNPPITGVWGDPRTDSLVVVGPPEADQAIRDTIAEWEGLQTGIDLRDDASLAAQFRQLRNTRRLALEQIARRKLEIIEAETRETPDADRLAGLIRMLKAESAGLEIVERKLKVISESIERFRGNGGKDSKAREEIPRILDSLGETPLWNEFGVTPAPVSPLTAKVLEWIGLHLSPIAKSRFRDKNVFAEYQGGLDVTFVRSHGPAEKAGIHEVDIVVRLQSRTIDSLDSLDSAMQFAAEQITRGDAESLQVDVLRSGKTLRVNIPLPVGELDLRTPGPNSDSSSPTSTLFRAESNPDSSVTAE